MEGKEKIVNWNIGQYKLSNLYNREKIDRKQIESLTCKTITKDLTFVSSKLQKQKAGLKK